MPVIPADLTPDALREIAAMLDEGYVADPEFTDQLRAWADVLAVGEQDTPMGVSNELGG